MRECRECRGCQGTDGKKLVRMIGWAMTAAFVMRRGCGSLRKSQIECVDLGAHACLDFDGVMMRLGKNSRWNEILAAK